MTPPSVLITGGLSDIGRATALAFVQSGHSVALGCHHRSAESEAFAAALVEQHGAARAVAVPADVRRPAEVRAMFDEAWAAVGPVRVLVNAAGLNRDRAFLEMTDEDWDDVRSTILEGTFYCCREFACRFTGEDGCIVNIGSVTALKGRRNGANYCSARAGVVALTKCLAQELAPRIRVVTVTPGMVDTREVRARYGLDAPESRARWEAAIPLGRLGSPREVAEVIEFLARPGSYVNGQNVLVDGGYHTP